MTKTLADMTAEERADCVGMWADAPGEDLAIIASASEPDVSWVFFPQSGGDSATLLDLFIAPRFDLPRAWTPDGEPVEMVKEYGIFYTLRDGDEEICFVHDSPLSVEPAVKHLEKSLRRGTITKITRKTQWVTEWEEVPEPQRTNGMVNPYV